MSQHQYVCRVDSSKVARPANWGEEDTPLTQKLADLILSEAVNHCADGIRMAASTGDKINIQYYVDGQWHEVDSPPRHLLEGILGELLILHNYGQGGIPLTKDGKAGSAKLSIEQVNVTISIPNFAS